MDKEVVFENMKLEELDEIIKEQEKVLVFLKELRNEYNKQD